MRLVSALFAAAVVAANAASTPTSDTCPSIQRGYDYPGNDLDNVQVSGSDQDKTDACCKACTNEISCAGWVISGSKCYLKNKLVGPKALSNAISGAYDAPDLTSDTCGNLVQDIDYSGNDIKDFDVTGTPQQVTNKCCNACSTTAKCVGFVTHDGHCWLKYAIGKASTRIGTIAGIYSGPLPTSSVCPSIQRGYDYPGNDLRNVQVSGSDQAKANACCEACTNEISCAGWVVTGNKCYLKNKLGSAKSLADALSGKYMAPALSSGTCSSLVQDVDFSGNDITDFGVTGSPQEVTNKCCDACSKTANCVGFVTHDGRCWLKNKWVRSGTQIGAIAGTYTAPVPTQAPATQAPAKTVLPTESPAPIFVVTPAPLPTETPAPLPTETPAPIFVETDAPVVKTDAPIFVETDAPVVKTDAPIFVETDAPVVKTDAPIFVETDAPVVKTDAPIFVETDAPVVKTDAPIFVETDAPVVKPDAPIFVETDAPIFVVIDDPLPTSDTCSSIVRGVDYPGNDLKSMTVSGSDQAQTFACCDACVKTPSCLGFVLHEGKCSLKWVLRGKTELNGALSGQYTVSRPGRPACLA